MHGVWQLTIGAIATLGVATVAERAVKSYSSSEIRRTWYDNGVQRDERRYEHGLEDGKHLGWWENGKPRLESTYSEGKREGRMIEWDASGKIFHLGHYRDGKEQGRQMMWNPDRSIRANYIVRDNRRYGFMGAVGCTGGDSTKVTADDESQ